jgi:hypothetical protein
MHGSRNKIPSKYLVRQRCAEGFKGLRVRVILQPEYVGRAKRNVTAQSQRWEAETLVIRLQERTMSRLEEQSINTSIYFVFRGISVLYGDQCRYFSRNGF